MGGLVSRMASSFQAADRDITDDRWFGGEMSAAFGSPVTAENAIMANAVFPIVSGIAETIGTLPLEIIRRDGSAGADYPYAEALCDQPNPLTSADEFWSTFAFNTVLRGRAYAEPIVHSSTELELWQLSPVRLVEDHGERTFGVDYFYENGRSRRFGQGELLTGSGISTDGVYSVVPWKAARLAIDMANTLEAFGRNFFKNGARPSGILSTEQTLTDPALERLKTQFNGNFAGVLNAGKVPILEASLKYLPIINNNVDNQYLELTRNALRAVARNWRYPLHMLGESESDQDAEQKAQEFVKYVIRPWTGRIERAIGRDLMTVEQRRVYRAKFDLDALLRGDSATQWRNAVLARTASLASANELRVNWFDLPRIEEEWADDPRTPLNSNRAADTTSGGMTSPQDRTDA